MASARVGCRKLLLLLGLIFFSSTGTTEAQLRVGFYTETCPAAEMIVREEARSAFAADIGLAPNFLRMHFHDCFVQGCDGSILIDSIPNNTAEKDFVFNNPSLRGYEVIDRAKGRLEAACAGVVSCADILAFIARESIVATGGFPYDVPSGRRDGRVSLSSEVAPNLPQPTFNLSENTQMFVSKGLLPEDVVILSGSHTIGRSHCPSFADRLYNFSNTGRQDPILDPAYAEELKRQCPRNESTNPNSPVVPMDPPTPVLLDSSYFRGILSNRGIFTSDMALLTSPATRAQVILYANNEPLFKRRFNEAVVRMGNMGVLTGVAGEIRRNCRVPN